MVLYFAGEREAEIIMYKVYKLTIFCHSLKFFLLPPPLAVGWYRPLVYSALLFVQKQWRWWLLLTSWEGNLYLGAFGASDP